MLLPRQVFVLKSQATFRQMEIVIAVAEAGSMTRAAQRLGTSKENVSLAVKRFEQNFGRQIFIREYRKIIPTSECLGVIEILQEALDVFDRLSLLD